MAKFNDYDNDLAAGWNMSQPMRGCISFIIGDNRNEVTGGKRYRAYGIDGRQLLGMQEFCDFEAVVECFI